MPTLAYESGDPTTLRDGERVLIEYDRPARPSYRLLVRAILIVGGCMFIWLAADSLHLFDRTVRRMLTIVLVSLSVACSWYGLVRAREHRGVAGVRLTNQRVMLSSGAEPLQIFNMNAIGRVELSTATRRSSANSNDAESFVILSCNARSLEVPASIAAAVREQLVTRGARAARRAREHRQRDYRRRRAIRQQREVALRDANPSKVEPITATRTLAQTNDVRAASTPIELLPAETLLWRGAPQLRLRGDTIEHLRRISAACPWIAASVAGILVFRSFPSGN